MSNAQKESSVLFSLHELMDLERDRIHEEEQKKLAAERAIADAAEAAERRRIEAEAARVRAAEEAERQELERARAEKARLDAMRLAEIQRAKADADHWAKLEAARQEHEHVQRLQALRSDKGKKQLTYGIAFATALLVLGGAGGGLALKSSHEATEAAQQSLAANEAERQKLLAQQADLESQQRGLEGALASAKTTAERLDLEKKEAELKALKARNDADLKAHPMGGVPQKPVGPAKPGRPCAPGDPLC